MSQTDQVSIAEMHYEPDCSQEQIEQVLSALDRWSSRTAKHVTHQRASDRHAYRTTVIVEPSASIAPDAGLRQLFTFRRGMCPRLVWDSLFRRCSCRSSCPT